MAERTCSIDGCGREASSRGMCDKHYRQWKRTANPAEIRHYGTTDRPCAVAGCDDQVGRKGSGNMCPTHYAQTRPPCSVHGCEKVSVTQGWCSMHYTRWARSGDPLTTPSGRVVRKPGLVCSVDGCGQPRRKLDWCASHYAQRYRTGEAKPFQYEWGSGGYLATHDMIARRRGRAAEYPCVDCGDPAAHWSYDWLDPDEKTDDQGRVYSRDAEHYHPRCASCHKRFDITFLNTKHGEQ